MRTIVQVLKWLYQLAGAELAVFLLIFLGLSCAPAAPGEDTATEQGQARQVLQSYLQALADEDYTTAASLYGGSTQFLQESNPDLDPQDSAQLLRSGCRLNGLQCLPVRGISAGQTLAPGVYAFDVEFNTRDGELFTRGPCCGATEAEMPTQAVFSFKVQAINGSFRVFDLPPYVP